MKMDHHCPWINNCVGHENHASFLRFTFYVPLGCLHGAILNANFLYRVVTNVSQGGGAFLKGRRGQGVGPSLKGERGFRLSYVFGFQCKAPKFTVYILHTHTHTHTHMHTHIHTCTHTYTHAHTHTHMHTHIHTCTHMQHMKHTLPLSQEFNYYRPYFPINMGWIIMAMMGIAVAMGAAIGVFILFATQVLA